MSVFRAALILFLSIAPSYAQWQTPAHSVPVGLGAGATGFSFAAPGTAGYPLISNGATSDPSFQPIGAGSLPPITNSMLVPGAAGTVKGSVNGTTVSDIALATITIPPPGGRLTPMTSSCTGAPPVQLGDVAPAGILCYVPYKTTYIPINGVGYSFSTLSTTTPNAAQTGIFDFYVVISSGVPTLGWNSTFWQTPPRAAGIALSALQPGGYYANAASITILNNSTNLGVFAPGTATYVGSAYMDSLSHTSWQLSPIPLSGGTNNCVCVFNAYNQVPLQAIERELDPFWVFGDIYGSWEYENGNQNNQFRILDGLGYAQYKLHVAMAMSAPTNVGQVAGAATFCYDCVLSGSAPVEPNNPIGTASQGGSGGTAAETIGTFTYGGAPWPGIGWGGSGGSIQNPLGLHSFSVIASGNNAGGTTGPEWYGNITSQATVEFND